MDWCDWTIFSHYPQTQIKDKKKTTKYKSVIYFKKGSKSFLISTLTRKLLLIIFLFIFYICGCAFPAFPPLIRFFQTTYFFYHYHFNQD